MNAPARPAAPPPGASAPAPLAELVRLHTEDRALLHGLLWQPAAKAKAVLLYVPGLTGNMCSPQDIGTFVRPLIDGGYAMLAMNLRIVGPPGLTHSRFEDCAPDIDAAVSFLKQRQFDRIVLLGDSLGGPRSCYYWHERKPAEIVALVLMASIPSPYEEAQLRWSEVERARFDSHLQRARGHIAADMAQKVMLYPEFQLGRSIALSAGTWVNTFGAPGESNASTVKYLPEVTVPVLILHGSRDTIAIPENGKTLLDAAKQAPQRELVFCDADHFFFAPPDALAYARPLCAWLDKTLR